MSFHESASRVDIVSTLQIAMVNGALWAIGSSWSTAIREIVVTFFPENSDDRVLAELGAAFITTFFGVGVAILATRKCTKCFTNKKVTKTPPRPLPQPLPSRYLPSSGSTQSTKKCRRAVS